jgi:hypothetical protein
VIRKLGELPIRGYVAAYAGLAQLVERFICNEDVVGSIPTTGTTFWGMTMEHLTHESFAPHVGTGFTIRTDDHDEVLTLTAVDPSKEYAQQVRQSFALLFDGSSNDLMFHSQLVVLSHPEMGDLPITISPIGRNEDGTYRYEAIFN